MRPEAASAIAKSIEIWEDRLKTISQHIGKTASKTGIKLSCDFCPLCQIYAWRTRCDGCSVSLRSGQPDCKGTPYPIAARLFYKEPISQKTIAAFQAEIDFLKSLQEV